MKKTLEVSSYHGANLGVPYVGTVKYAETHSMGNPNYTLDNPYCVRHHKIAVP